eukprot:TRINITY_DN8711_c0_g1_i1.p1 TRINITY_DN8711_c0_g1~~TRINITY_DN8711_c0_g1_i1.p1  ORF type:complete len:1132 (-),score=283.26 TRINITY_DN8711_c0_g1_i1:255-3650(-)
MDGGGGATDAEKADAIAAEVPAQEAPAVVAVAADGDSDSIIASTPAPETPQKPRQQRNGSDRTEERHLPTAVGLVSPAGKTPPSQATTQTPHTGNTSPGQSRNAWSASRARQEEEEDLEGINEEDIGALFGSDGEDDDEEDEPAADAPKPAPAGLQPPDVKGGRGRATSSRGAYGGKAGGRGKGQSQKKPGGWPPGWSGPGSAAESRLPPPPPAGSLKALPPEHVQRMLQLVQEGDYPEALKALRKVRRAVKGRGCSKEAFGGMRALLHHLLEGYAAAGRLREALDILRDMKKGAEARLVSAAAFNALLRGLLVRGALDEARAVVRQEMPWLGATPNEASLNLLMDCAARAAHADEAWDILEEMQQRALRADKYTVSILTKGISDRVLGDKRRVPRGVTLVEKFLVMQQQDVDEVLVNSLLDVFCRMGDMPRLEATLRKMREYNIRGSAVTYGTIVKAYGKAGNIDKVLQAWSEMERVGLEANAVTYGCMLDACVKCGHLDKALNVFAAMKEHGIHRNTILYATLIKGFAKSKDPLAARNLHREMVVEGVPCNVVVFNSLIDACVRASDLHGAAEVLQQMTGEGVRPDLITFSTLIKGYCSSGELSKAMCLAEELTKRDLECDEIVYNSLLEGCVKAGDLQLGMRLFTEMKTRNVRPSAVTFSILVKLLSRAGRLDLALHLVAVEMREMHGVAPTRMVWSCLVNCCTKSRDIGKAVLVLDHLDRDTQSVGNARAPMYATVIEACLSQAEVGTAMMLSERCYTRAPPEEYGKFGLLSLDTLRRVFETAASHHREAEARAHIDAICACVGEQVRGSLDDAVTRGIASRRKNSPRGATGGPHKPVDSNGRPAEKAYGAPGPNGSCALGGVLATAAATAPGSMTTWPEAGFLPGMGAEVPYGGFGAMGGMHGMHGMGAHMGGMHGMGGMGGLGAMPFQPPPPQAQSWDPVYAAAYAAAAAVAQPYAYPQPGMEMYGGGYGPGPYGGPEAYGGWNYHANAWEDGAVQAAASAAAAAASAARAAAFAAMGSSPPPAAGYGEFGTAPGHSFAEAASPAPATPSMSNGAGKAFEPTPATTAGATPTPASQSPPMNRATQEDADAKTLQKSLFSSEPGQPGAEEEGGSGGRVLDRPPGLC